MPPGPGHPRPHDGHTTAEPATGPAAPSGIGHVLGVHHVDGVFNMPAFEDVLDAAKTDARYYYAPTTDADETTRRLVELVAKALQSVAADITDAAARHSHFTVDHVVATLRVRATELSPESAEVYDPMTHVVD